MGDSKKDTDTKNRLLDSVGKGEVGWFERTALKYIYYHVWNRWPVQVWCMKQGTQSWCTGKTLRGGMGREVRGGFRMGGHMYTHGWFMSMYGKNHYIISLQLKQINFLKKKVSYPPCCQSFISIDIFFLIYLLKGPSLFHMYSQGPCQNTGLNLDLSPLVQNYTIPL